MYSDNFPHYRGHMEYACLKCGARFPADRLLYTCPACGGVFLLENTDFASLKATSGDKWRQTFDERQMTRHQALKGIFRFYELLAPILEEKDIIWLGEGNTPIVEAAERFIAETGVAFAYKNDGQNPSASFKDRGMACAFSYLKWLCARNQWPEVLTICASTGDTSAAAALYAAYVGSPIKSVVILPGGKVTPQQLSQPLGSGAVVIEIPGVFDDCMKVVEILAENYRVALLNSKNSWRILGQESYAYEIAQWRAWDVGNVCVFVPVGNAGNITAIMSGFLKMLELGIIASLPRIFGVQSHHADPVYRYYAQQGGERHFNPVTVQPSVAQAAMIGNPVSFPRVAHLAQKFMELGGQNAFQVVSVTEQEIMDAMLEANRHGHIACTQGGECLAGLRVAVRSGVISAKEYAILDSTAHSLKFAGFQEQYFNDEFDASYGITPKAALQNRPRQPIASHERDNRTVQEYASMAADIVARELELQKI